MNRSYSRQRGMSPIGMLLVLAIGAFFFYLGILLFPMYYSSFQVSAAIESMKSEPGLAQKTQGEIVKLLKRRFESGYVDDVDATDVVIEKLPKGVRLSLSYDIEKSFIGNLDLVGHFETEVETGN